MLVYICDDGGTTRTELKTTVAGTCYQRYKLTDTVTIDTVESTCDAFDYSKLAAVHAGFPCKILKVFSLCDGAEAIKVTVQKDQELGVDSHPTLDVLVDMVEISLSPAVANLIIAISPGSSILRQFDLLRAAKPQRPRNHLIARSPRMEPYKTKNYEVQGLNIALENAAQMEIVEVSYRKWLTDPATECEAVNIDTFHAWNRGQVSNTPMPLPFLAALPSKA